MSREAGRYELVAGADRLVFRTPHYTAGRGSVLHTGIYNREFASALTAFAAAGLAYMAVALQVKKGLAAHAIFLAVFAGGFVALRTFVFREKYLEAVFALPSRSAEIFLSGMRRRRTAAIAFSEIDALRIEQERLDVANRDGAEFVSKISAQHGMAMPGFDEEKKFFVLKLKLRNGNEEVLYASEEMESALKAYEGIRGFLGAAAGQDAEHAG